MKRPAVHLDNWRAKNSANESDTSCFVEDRRIDKAACRLLDHLGTASEDPERLFKKFIALDDELSADEAHCSVAVPQVPQEEIATAGDPDRSSVNDTMDEEDVGRVTGQQSAAHHQHTVSIPHRAWAAGIVCAAMLTQYEDWLQGQKRMVPESSTFLAQLRGQATVDVLHLHRLHVVRGPGGAAQPEEELCKKLPNEWLPMRNMLLSENRGNDLDRLIVLTGLAALLKQVAWVPLEHHNHQTSSSQGPEEKRINHGATSTQEDAQLHLTVAPRRMNPRRIKPDARPGQLSEAERNFVSTTAGLHACAQSYLSMTCTHDAETFLASASLVMQHGEDLLCMPPQPMEELSVQVLKRMAPCKFCKVQQTLWAFKMIVFVEGADSCQTEEGWDMLVCCRCAEKRFGVTVESACSTSVTGELRAKRPLVTTKSAIASVSCMFFRDHLMLAAELMLRASERGVDEWTDCMPESVLDNLSNDRSSLKCPARDVSNGLLPSLTDFSNLRVGEFAHANAMLMSQPVTGSKEKLQEPVKRNQALSRGLNANSLTCMWQPNGYGHLQLPETPVANAIILRQFPDDHPCAQLTSVSPPDEKLLRTTPRPDEYNRLFEAVRAAPHMGCALPKHLVHSEEYMSPTGPGLSQAASCLASAPHYPHVHFSRHVIGLIYTEPKWHKQLIDTAHTGLHMDPIGAACLMLADGKEDAARWLFTYGDSSPQRFLQAKSLVYQAAYAGGLKRIMAASGRTTPNADDLFYAQSQAEALRIQESDMIELQQKHPKLFMTITHRPGELMIVPPGAAHAVVNLRPNTKISWTGLPPKWVCDRSMLQGIGCALPVCIHNQLFRCTPVQRSADESDICWLPHKDLIGDEGETQRGLALEGARVLSEVSSSEEKLMQNESLCSAAAPGFFGAFF